MDSQFDDLLKRCRAGDKRAEAELFSLLYKELRRLAGHYLRRERVGHTLQPTALVHEVYVRLIDSDSVEWQDRTHVLTIASRAMRRILVDHARSRQAAKRNPLQPVVDDGGGPFSDAKSAEVLAIHTALDKLASAEPRQARIVELRYFGGLSFEEAAQTLGVSTRTAKRDWNLARLMLHEWITGTAP
jgi:RNA polymerase sigma factor (TIGR02999 family)